MIMSKYDIIDASVREYSLGEGGTYNPFCRYYSSARTAGRGGSLECVLIQREGE